MLKIKYNLTMNHLITSKHNYISNSDFSESTTQKYYVEGLKKNKHFYFIL